MAITKLTIKSTKKRITKSEYYCLIGLREVAKTYYKLIDGFRNCGSGNLEVY